MAHPNASTLSHAHSLLLREVTTRAETLLSEADEDRGPEPQLGALVDYLHLEVLQQVIDEEWLVFRSGQYARAELARLRGDHVDLRLAIEVLAHALGCKGTLMPKELAAC